MEPKKVLNYFQWISSISSDDLMLEYARVFVWLIEYILDV